MHLQIPHHPLYQVLFRTNSHNSQPTCAHNCVMRVAMHYLNYVAMNDMCRHHSDVSLSHSFKDKSHYVKNGRHFCKIADAIGMMYSAILFSGIYAPQNLYIESTLKVLRLIVSEIDVLLWKWPPFCKMAFTMSDRVVWYISQYFFWNLRLTKPIYTVKVEGSAPLSFWDSGHFGKMTATTTLGIIWLDTIATFTCFGIMYMCAKCHAFTTKARFYLICWTNMKRRTSPLS